MWNFQTLDVRKWQTKKKVLVTLGVLGQSWFRIFLSFFSTPLLFLFFVLIFFRFGTFLTVLCSWSLFSPWWNIRCNNHANCYRPPSIRHESRCFVFVVCVCVYDGLIPDRFILFSDLVIGMYCPSFVEKWGPVASHSKRVCIRTSEPRKAPPVSRYFATTFVWHAGQVFASVECPFILSLLSLFTFKIVGYAHVVYSDPALRPSADELAAHPFFEEKHWKKNRTCAPLHCE